MNTLKHKGFVCVFNYIEDEDVLFGKIVGIRDLVTFEGESIQEVKSAFKYMVKEYLQHCKEEGKEPLKSFEV